MNPTHRRLAMAGALLLLSAAFFGVRAEHPGTDRPRDPAETTIALRTQEMVPSSYAASPARAAAPSMSTLDAEDSVSGSEPDPASFDRRGLEKWWRHFQETTKKVE